MLEVGENFVVLNMVQNVPAKNVFKKFTGNTSQRNCTIGNTRVSVAYYSFYDNIQLCEINGMKVTAMEYNLWSYQ